MKNMNFSKMLGKLFSVGLILIFLTLVVVKSSVAPAGTSHAVTTPTSQPEAPEKMAAQGPTLSLPTRAGYVRKCEEDTGNWVYLSPMTSTGGFTGYSIAVVNGDCTKKKK